MKKSVWRWIGLGAAISLLLVYFIELTSHGLQRMDGSVAIKQAYEQNIAEQQIQLQMEQLEALERVTVPTTSLLDSEITKLEQEILSLKKQALKKEKNELEQMLLNNDADQSNVNKLADSTSGALQQLSSSSMQFVAELFHKVIN